MDGAHHQGCLVTAGDADGERVGVHGEGPPPGGESQGDHQDDVAHSVVFVMDSASNMAAKKTSTKTPSKSDFIRNQPTSLSAAEVVAKAKAAGIKFSSQLVYNVRGGSKAANGSRKKAAKIVPSKSPPKVSKAKKARTPRARKAPAVPRSVATTPSAENLLRAVAAEVGLGRAVEILQGERARVRAVIGG